MNLDLTRLDEIWADSAEPKSIEELHRMGWNVKPTAKGADSIMAGIDILKRHKMFVTKESKNALRSFRTTNGKRTRMETYLTDLLMHSTTLLMQRDMLPLTD
jgi:phage terminase large subunit